MDNNVFTREEIIEKIAGVRISTEVKLMVNHLPAASWDEEKKRLWENELKATEASLDEYDRILRLKADEAISHVSEPALRDIILAIVTVLIGPKVKDK